MKKKMIAGTVTAALLLSTSMVGVSFASPMGQFNQPKSGWNMGGSGVPQTPPQAMSGTTTETMTPMPGQSGAMQGQMGQTGQMLSGGLFESDEILEIIESYYDDLSDDWSDALESLESIYEDIEEVREGAQDDALTDLQDLIEDALDDTLDDDLTYEDLVNAISDMDDDESDDFKDALFDAIVDGEIVLGGFIQAHEATGDVMESLQEDMEEAFTLYEELAEAVSNEDTDAIEDALDALFELLEARVDAAQDILDDLE